MKIHIAIEANLYIESCCFLATSSFELLSTLLPDASSEDITLLLQIQQNTNAYGLCEFFVHSPSKKFEDILSFIKTLSPKTFLYYYHNESIPMNQITIESDSEILYFRDFLIDSIQKIGSWISSQSPAFNYEPFCDTIYNLLKTKPPLEAAQDYMGKRFARISDYQSFYFVPSQFACCHPMRFFNDSTLMLLVPTTPVVQSLPIDEMSMILKIIGDPTRLAIMKLLKSKAMYGKEIADALSIKAPTITHHIEQLNRIKLLHMEQIGQIKYYSLNQLKFDTLLESLKNI